jgi:hypothetical protein
MYKFKLNGNDYEVPNKWEDIKLGHYMSIFNINYNESEYTDIILLKSLIPNMTDEVLDDMSLELFKDIQKELGFLRTNPKFKPKQVVNIDGEDYIFKSNFNKLTMGEIASIKTYDAKYGTNSLPYTLSILLRKAIKDENGELTQEKIVTENIERNAKRFLDLPIYEWFGSVNFFLNTIKI